MSAGIEDNYYMFHVRAVSFHILTELFGNGSITFQQVFTCHAGFAGGTP